MSLEFDNLRLYNSYEPLNEDGLYVIIQLTFLIKNIGRIVANNWQLNIIGLSSDSDVINLDKMLLSTYNFPRQKIPKTVSTGISVGSRAILPECSYQETINIGFMLRPHSNTIDNVAAELNAFVNSVKLSCKVASETSPGEVAEISLQPGYDPAALKAAIQERCPEYFNEAPH